MDNNTCWECGHWCPTGHEICTECMKEYQDEQWGSDFESRCAEEASR